MGKMVIRLSLLYLFGFFNVTLVFSQKYKIDLTIEEFEAKDILLGYYLDGKTYIKDSAKYFGESKYSISGDEPLEKGMYFLASGSSILFDLVIGEDQIFKLETKGNDYASSMKVFGDQENQLFFDNMRFNLEM